MNPRKQRAMEERHISRSLCKPKPKIDWREECPEMKYIIEDIQIAKKWGGKFAYRDMRRKYHLHFKNGGEMFDQALKLLESPLWEALS